MKTKNIALITSTIAPDPNVFLLKRSDPKERLLDYQKAFRFYCEQLRMNVFDNIVYVDNSGYPLDSLKKIAAEKDCQDRVEFISYSSLADPTKSRFYLEINLIKYALEKSVKINDANKNFVWKITGRYVIKNIQNIVVNSPEDVDLYINCRNYPYKLADFYCIGFIPEKYSTILGNMDEYFSTEDGEILFRKRIDNNLYLNITKRFNITPKIIGIRGYDARQYNDFNNNAKYYSRVLMNIFFPKIWI